MVNQTKWLLINSLQLNKQKDTKSIYQNESKFFMKLLQNTWLGIILDAKLCWKVHLKKKKAKLGFVYKKNELNDWKKFLSKNT